jgi:hypothetical protein
LLASASVAGALPERLAVHTVFCGAGWLRKVNGEGFARRTVIDQRRGGPLAGEQASDLDRRPLIR